MAGIGMDAAVIAGMNPTLKRTLKEAAFFVQGVATLLTREEPLLIVETPDHRVEGYFIVIGNSSNYGGAFGITPLADMRDGLLDVCVLKDRSFLTTAWYWVAALTNSHVKHPAVEYFRTETACIAVADGESEVLVQTDGEVAGHLPIDCRIAPRALRVIVP
jgi:diacylglycerol kinase (ATP)